MAAKYGVRALAHAVSVQPKGYAFSNTSSAHESAFIMLGNPSVVVAIKMTCRISLSVHPASSARRVWL